MDRLGPLPRERPSLIALGRLPAPCLVCMQLPPTVATLFSPVYVRIARKDLWAGMHKYLG